MLKTKPKLATVKILVFSVGELYLAVHLDAVEKVILLPQIFSSGQKPVGVAQVGDSEIMILDLHRRLFNQPSSVLPSHVIILKSSHQVSFGIPISSLPEILDVLQSEIRPLPENYREKDTLGIANQAVTISKKEQTFSAFLLPPESFLDLF